MNALEIVIDHTPYLLPAARVVEVALRVEVRRAAELTAPIVGFAGYRGASIPVVDLRECLGHPRRPPALADRFVITRVKGRLVALVVDEVRGLRDVPRDVRAVAKSTPHLTGAALTADGIVYLADVDATLSLEDEKHIDEALAVLRRRADDVVTEVDRG